MSEQLNRILENFKSKLSYREQDKRALDLSRAAATGSLGEKEYSEWALISNDPLVVINYVKTFITTLASKLASAPFRPADDKLNDLMLSMRINSKFVELYKMTLADGYAFLGLGIQNGQPIANIIDARSIMFNGTDPTLKDATELIVFEILPKSQDDDFITDFPTGYVDYDPENEKVKTSYYYIKNGIVNLDVYVDGVAEPSHYEIPNVDRIPVVRFYGEKFELTDKRYHYRGLYYQMAGIIKATALAATKLQIRTAMSDDDNYIVASDAIANNKGTWRNSGVKTIDNYDANGNQISSPVIPISHDNGFLLQALETWKNVTSDMLGPVVQSSSEAITREEVIARNEVRDAIANTYLANIADSISEVYRVINAMVSGNTNTVTVQGGFIESAQRGKLLNDITNIYQLAKASGLNTQGFIFEILASSDLPMNMRQRLGQLMMQDPFNSPAVQQLKAKLDAANATIQQQTNTITQLRIMASQRLERQAEFVASQERIKRFETMFKQWQQENKDTQEARMEILRKLLDAGDFAGAMAMLQAINKMDTPVLTSPVTQMQMEQADEATKGDLNASIYNTSGNSGIGQGSVGQSATDTLGTQYNRPKPVTTNPLNTGTGPSTIFPTAAAFPKLG